MTIGITHGRGLGVPVLAALVLVLHDPPLGARHPAIKPEELVAKHLASIGSAEARSAVKNRVAGGTAQVSFRLPTSGRLAGNGTVLSDGRKVRIDMVFAALDYQSERLVFDGRSVDVGQLRLRVRSNLADFVYQYDVLLKEGLMGGTMTTAWPLLDLAGRQPKLDYAGLRKVEGRQLHELRYRPRKGAWDLQIALFFDPQDFRHVLSQYRLIVRGRMAAAPPDSTSQMDTFYRIDERFDDFRPVDALILPHTYQLVFSREGPGTGVLCEYRISLDRILHNQSIDANAFVIH